MNKSLVFVVTGSRREYRDFRRDLSRDALDRYDFRWFDAPADVYGIRGELYTLYGNWHRRNLQLLMDVAKRCQLVFVAANTFLDYEET